MQHHSIHKVFSTFVTKQFSCYKLAGNCFSARCNFRLECETANKEKFWESFHPELVMKHTSSALEFLRKFPFCSSD